MTFYRRNMLLSPTEQYLRLVGGPTLPVCVCVRVIELKKHRAHLPILPVCARVCIFHLPVHLI